MVPVVPEWTREHAGELRAALGSRPGARDGAFGYCELAGFFFALACAPELVRPSEWIPLVLGEDPAAHGSREQAQRLLDLAMRLHNHVNAQVLERAPSLPVGIEARPEPMDNFASDAPLSQWARGFSEGHAWLEKVWDASLEDQPEEDAEALDEALGGIAMMLGFFASREFAENCIAEIAEPRPLEQMAPQILEAIPDAMRELAEIGRELYEIDLARRTPARSAKVGRNAPCPCGSGRKYKHCCGASRAS
ncbi:MAG TPA: UPF0149 family protein [Burkholderiales bacterium]|nr:UPF0149 family protein [Burkholderiales bacterium]